MYYSLMGKMRLSFIDSDLLYRGALLGRFDCIHINSQDSRVISNLHTLDFFLTILLVHMIVTHGCMIPCM